MTFRYAIEREDFEEAAMATARIDGDWTRPLRVVGYGAAAVGFLCLFATTREPIGRGAPVALLLTGLFVLIYPQVAAARRTRRDWRDEHEESTDDVTVEAGETGLLFVSPRSSTWQAWSQFHRVVETRRLFVLCSGGRTVRAIVPKRSLPEPERLGQFRRLLTEKVPARLHGFPVASK